MSRRVKRAEEMVGRAHVRESKALWKSRRTRPPQHPHTTPTMRVLWWLYCWNIRSILRTKANYTYTHTPNVPWEFMMPLPSWTISFVCPRLSFGNGTYFQERTTKPESNMRSKCQRKSKRSDRYLYSEIILYTSTRKQYRSIQCSTLY